MKPKGRREGLQTLRILRRYFMVTFVCLCVCALACGIFVAENNTRRLRAGESAARVVLSQQEDQLSLQTGRGDFSLQTTVHPQVDSLLRFAPPPISNLYWVVQSVAQLWE